jgi:2-polyprenyl-6-methoxyphenol hydroxylase-like FAD-dependent oxidoreductase
MCATRAVIIGAGIGGLAAGIALREAGLAVEVYERSSVLREVGAGISLWANAIHALELLGLGEALHAASVPYCIDGLRTCRGAQLVSVSASELERRIGTPIVVLPRPNLLALLLSAFGTQNLHCGARCTGFRHDAKRAVACFDDGRQEKADLIVGADGLHSVIRAALHGDRPPRYAGCTAWRAAISFPGHTIEASESWGYGSVFGKVPMYGDQVYWYATKNAPEGQGFASEKAELLRHFQGWHAPIQELIEATDESAILRNDIYDRPCLKTWSQGCVTLLGDAAHPMLPFLGQGGCQALEDAVVLGQCLQGATAVDAALREYEVRRIPRTDLLVKRSQMIGRIAQLQNSVAVALRNAAFALVSPRLQLSQLAQIAGHKV